MTTPGRARPRLNRPLVPAPAGRGAARRARTRRDARPARRPRSSTSGCGWRLVDASRWRGRTRGAEVIGVDIDAPSIEMARGNAAEPPAWPTGSSFRIADGGSLARRAGFDVAFAFECVHDMPRPVEVLAAVRRSLRPDGVVVVMDEAVADEFTAPGDDVERSCTGSACSSACPTDVVGAVGGHRHGDARRRAARVRRGGRLQRASRCCRSRTSASSVLPAD